MDTRLDMIRRYVAYRLAESQTALDTLQRIPRGDTFARVDDILREMAEHEALLLAQETIEDFAFEWRGARAQQAREHVGQPPEDALYEAIMAFLTQRLIMTGRRLAGPPARPSAVLFVGALADLIHHLSTPRLLPVPAEA